MEDYLVWYVLFIIFVTYAMLPLQLRWCMSTGLLTAMLHIIIVAAFRQQDEVKNFFLISRYFCFDTLLFLSRKLSFFARKLLRFMRGIFNQR